MSEELVKGIHNIVRQTDSGFGVDARADSGGPLSSDPPCSSDLLYMTLSWVGSPVVAPGIKFTVHVLLKPGLKNL